MKTNTETERATRHAAGCARVFSRYDATCPRCQELQAGAKARKGWGRGRETDAAFRARLAAHDCKVSHCGPVCVAFDH